MIVTKRRVRDAVDAAVPSREAGAGPAARPVSDDLARERTALLSVFANARPDVHMPAKASWAKGGSRTAKPCGPGTRCWCQVGGGVASPTGLDQPYSSTTVTRRIRRRGEQGISRKTIAQGNAGCSGVPVVTTVCIFCCTRAAGAPRTRHSPRPHAFCGARRCKTRARCAATSRMHA
jgi:hypothetical protein